MSIIKVYGKNAGKLKDKTVLIVGIGGLGCTVSNLLARMQIRLILMDHDIIDDTNLERQTLYDKDDLLKPKVNAAKNRLGKFTKIESVYEELTKENIDAIIKNKDIDLIMDCSDNIKTRLLLNDYCKKNKINWIYSGAVSNIGTVFFIDNENNSPCYQCINQEKDGATSCEVGVLNTTVTTVASLAVNIAINYLVNNKIEDKLIRINMQNNETSKLIVKTNKNCDACKKRYKYL